MAITTAEEAIEEAQAVAAKAAVLPRGSKGQIALYAKANALASIAAHSNGVGFEDGSVEDALAEITKGDAKHRGSSAQLVAYLKADALAAAEDEGSVAGAVANIGKFVSGSNGQIAAGYAARLAGTINRYTATIPEPE